MNPAPDLSRPPWAGSTAIVTGAASGIGLALSKALLGRGATVFMTDIDAAGLSHAATGLGAKAQAELLDVRDAAAVRELVERVAREHGRLDFLFTNAGIGIGGEAHEMIAAHYERVIDVNIRGVTNGIAAAYPLMARQRAGHIVITASLAGLTPVPLLTPYAMSKHALVGLSTSLRLEATRHGVRVSALCPAAVETPLLDAGLPADLPAMSWRPDLRRYLTRLAGAPYPVERLAEDALRGIARNQALIVLPARARIVARLYRWLPGMVQREIASALDAELRHRTA